MFQILQPTLHGGPAPLGAEAFKRNLCDKSYEKRKIAALDIERYVRSVRQFPDGSDKVTSPLVFSAPCATQCILDPTQENNATDWPPYFNCIIRLINVLNIEFLQSSMANHRKGGLLGLASVALGLGEDAIHSLPIIVPYIMKLFSDQDARVRFYACESAYNVVKLCHESILPYFDLIFDGLCKTFADLDHEVNHGAHFLDRLVKDVVRETVKFDVSALIPLLSLKINAKNPYVRQLLISWISVLDSIPEVNLLASLSYLIHGLFDMLSDASRDIRYGADNCLNIFKIRLNELSENDFELIVPNLILPTISRCYDPENLCRLSAIIWLHDFIKRGAPLLLKQNSLKKFVEPILYCMADPEEEISKIASKAHNCLYSSFQESALSCDINGVVELVREKLNCDLENISVAPLQWSLLILIMRPEVVKETVDCLFEPLFQTLKSSNDAAVLLSLKILSRISEYDNYFVLMTRRLLKFFSDNQSMLETNGRMIFQKLCENVDVEKLYVTLANCIQELNDLQFCHNLVQTLNWILLTYQETNAFRRRLRSADEHLILKIFIPWLNNPISALSLSLWVKEYKLAYELVCIIGTLHPSVDFFVELDQFLQLLDSPVFSEMRINLLRPRVFPSLVKTLAGLSMLIPQNSSFVTLKNRLDMVQLTLLLESDVSQTRCVESFMSEETIQLILEKFNVIVQKQMCQILSVETETVSSDVIFPIKISSENNDD